MCFEDEIYSYESHFCTLRRAVCQLDMDLCSYTIREWEERRDGAAKLVSTIKRELGEERGPGRDEVPKGGGYRVACKMGCEDSEGEV